MEFLAGIGLSFATKLITLLGTKVTDKVVGKEIDRRIVNCYRDSAKLLYEECKKEGWSDQRLDALLHVLSLDEVQELIATSG